MPSFKVDLTDEQVRNLLDLAEKRGVDANTIVQQAIGTETLLSENVGKSDDLLIRRSDQSFSKVNFANG